MPAVNINRGRDKNKIRNKHKEEKEIKTKENPKIDPNSLTGKVIIIL